jgi:hypothetical protein
MHKILLRRRIWISRYNAMYIQQEVVEGRSNCLGGVIGLVEKLVTIRELVKKI